MKNRNKSSEKKKLKLGGREEYPFNMPFCFIFGSVHRNNP